MTEGQIKEHVDTAGENCMHSVVSSIKPAKNILRPVGKAISDYQMISDGDRLLLGLSGGKDSLTLLHVLHHLQSYAPVKFDLSVATVDPCIDGFDPSPLKGYLAGLGIDYYYSKQEVARQAAENMQGDSFCAYCSRMRRGILYSTARKHNCNKLVLAQHLDDLAESFMMSVFHGGSLRTMKASYTIDAGDLQVIRPFVYVRERQLEKFAQQSELPVIADNCPACFSRPTQRQHMKLLLAQEEKATPQLFANMLHAMRPLMGEMKLKGKRLKTKD
ncbi:MAG: ATP-binding protein [Arenicellales bacterium]|jgi:tRNA(Ile)-lysidine synthase TilS/MesJ